MVNLATRMAIQKVKRFSSKFLEIMGFSLFLMTLCESCGSYRAGCWDWLTLERWKIEGADVEKRDAFSSLGKASRRPFAATPSQDDSS